jgi:DNA-binding transcriptional LysR family regulator
MPIFTTAARCLVEVINAGSIRRAAEILNTAPSAVNRHILNLEAEYQTILLERLPRGVRATPAGNLFVDQIRKWQSEMDALTADLATLRGLERKQISIGIVECFAGSFFAEVLSEIHPQHPGLAVTIRVGGTHDLVTLLEQGVVDMVVAFNLPPSSNFWVLDSLAAPIGVVVPAGHAFAGRSSLLLSECRDESVLLADASLTLRPLLDAVLPNAIALSQVPLTSNSIAMIKGAIRSGAGIAILTPFDVRDEVASGTLVFVPLESPHVSETLSICVRDQSSISALDTLFCKTIMRSVRSQIKAT